MAIGNSNISFSQLRTEYGVIGATSASQLYRGGSYIRAKASNNQADNLAPNVPTSGAISVDNFKGSAKGFKYTYTANATDQDISDLFGDDYGVSYPKEVEINSGVELGATTTGNEALEADTGLSGTLTITNNGTITGRGGAAGQAGGDAFEANVTCTFVNNGTLRAGGGGGGAGGSGGAGGRGGQGRYQQASSAWTSWSYQTQSMSQTARVENTSNQGQAQTWYRWYGTNHGASYNASSSVYQGIQYQRGTQRGTQYYMDGDVSVTGFNIRRYQTTYTWVYTGGGYGGAGGSGGSGGSGAGYQQSAGTGASGSGGSGGQNGSTNAGKGGTGGTGGTGGAGGGFGQAGSSGSNGNTGATGNSGNYAGGQGGSAGQSGQSGGAAGKYLRGSSNVTFTNNGTVQGGTA